MTEVLHALHSGRAQGPLQDWPSAFISDRCHQDKSLGRLCSAFCSKSWQGGCCRSGFMVLWGVLPCCVPKQQELPCSPFFKCCAALESCICC